MARTGNLTIREWSDFAAKSAYRASTLSKLMGVCPRQLGRYTHATFGNSPQEWLDEQRLIMAVAMLRKNIAVKEVALTLGFKQTSHFSREFKLRYGLSPTAFLLWIKRENVPNDCAFKSS